MSLEKAGHVGAMASSKYAPGGSIMGIFNSIFGSEDKEGCEPGSEDPDDE